MPVKICFSLITEDKISTQIFLIYKCMSEMIFITVFKLNVIVCNRKYLRNQK